MPRMHTCVSPEDLGTWSHLVAEPADDLVVLLASGLKSGAHGGVAHAAVHLLGAIRTNIDGRAHADDCVHDSLRKDTAGGGWLV
eukprot:353770-Chlamydomonas_euryale.AAC.6